MMTKEFQMRLLSSIVLIPFCLFVIIKGSFLFNFLIAICFLISIYEWHLMSKNKKYYLAGFIFLFISFYSTYNLRNNFDENSLSYFLFVILICICTDIGGYIFGKFFKGPKLLVKISPNKTYSGVVGGYLLPIIIIFLGFKYLDFLLFQSYIFTNEILILIILFSTISQVGDMIISIFKRLSNIKDTGKIIPGHGGLLDRIDGMIFVFPFSYIIYLLYF